MKTQRCLEGKLTKIEAHSLTVFGSKTNVKGVRSLTVENVRKDIRNFIIFDLFKL